MNAIRPSIRLGILIAVAAATAEALARVLGNPGAPPPPPGRAINPYFANPYIVQGRPFLFWYAPGDWHIQQIGDHATRYDINAAAFRGPSLPAQPAPGVRRALLLGDSVVEGFGVAAADTFVSRLAQTLAPAHWEAVNASIQGASPVYYAANWPRYAALHPDALVVMLSENDLFEDRTREQAYTDLPTWRPPPGVPPPNGARLAIADDIAAAATALRYVFRPTPMERLVRDNVHGWRKATACQWWSRRTRSTVGSADFEAAWALSARYLEALAADCERAHVRLLLGTLNLQATAFAQPDARDFEARLDGAAADWARARGVPFLALTPALTQQEGAAAVREGVTGDAHLTPAGHAAAARVLDAWLRSALASPSASCGGSSASLHSICHPEPCEGSQAWAPALRFLAALGMTNSGALLKDR